MRKLMQSNEAIIRVRVITVGHQVGWCLTVAMWLWNGGAMTVVRWTHQCIPMIWVNVWTKETVKIPLMRHDPHHRIKYLDILAWPTKVATGADSFFTSIDLWVNSHAGLTSYYRQVVFETAIHHRESHKSSIKSEDDQNIPTNSPTDEFDCSVCLQEDFSESLELKRPQISGQELCCHGKRWCIHIENVLKTNVEHEWTWYLTSHIITLCRQCPFTVIFIDIRYPVHSAYENQWVVIT